MLRRARITVAYDGSGFHGFAEAEGVRTVLGELRRVISVVTRHDVELVGAGRTDAGVHGHGQVISGDLPEQTDLSELCRRINRMLGPAIALRDAEWTADPEFHARFSATWRRYRYHVLNAPAPVPLLATAVWHVPQPLDLWAMQLACDPLIGEHDFSSFCRRPKVDEGMTPPSMSRRILGATWSRVEGDVLPGPVDGLLRFEITANAFCHQMVRSIVGTLVEVGLGKRRAGDMRTVLLARDRSAAGQVAPPDGLVLWQVGYGDSPR
ncbi:MAG: tRNA pseudouridine synthase [Actinomycetota bacterium]|jgi:tRNA pseudouridine38-40 synthase